MDGLARPRSTPNRHRRRQRSDRRRRAPVVRAMGCSGGDRVGCSRARFPGQCLANHQTSATALLLGASVASLLGVGFALTLAGRASGTLQVLLIGFAVLTVVLSWTVVNTVFTLRYADLHFESRDRGIAFDDSDEPAGPTYRDFAYVAFTIGMCYQVSDTAIRDRRIRRTVLSHALLSYMFGAAIVGGSVNLIAGLIR